MAEIDPTDTQARVARLRRTSRIMVWTCRAMAALGPLALLAVWAQFESLAGAVLPSLQIGTLTAVDRIGGYLISLVPAGIAAWGFLTLSRLFAAFAHGVRLDAANARRLRHFALAVLFLVPAKLLASASLSVWLTRAAGPGDRQLILSISSDDLAILVVGILLLVLASVLREAAEIADEHRQFV